MPEEYDLQEKALYTNPYPFYHKLRSHHPVHLDSHFGCWVVSSYRDAALALANRSLSSERAMHGAALHAKEWNELSPLFAHISNLMFFTDPPRHTQIRSLINKAFSSHMTEKWRYHIQRIVDAQLDLVQDKGRMDIIQDIAYPLPAQVIADMIGFPAHDLDKLKHWSDDLAVFLGNAPTIEICKRLMHSLQEFMEYFRPIMRHHRKHPQNDVIDEFIRAEDQSILTEDDILVNCVGLFAGGHETTTNLIGNGLLALLRNPQEMQKLRDNPDLMTSAVEELLRYDSSVQFTGRIAKQTTQIGEKKIYKGQHVMVMLGAANRDPSQFYQPDHLDLSRQNNRHMAFGHNVHYCIGAAIARLEAQITFTTILRRMPNLQLETFELEWQENLSMHGLKKLHVAF